MRGVMPSGPMPLLTSIHTHSVMFTRIEWWSHARVWFLHADCNFQTQCDFDTHKCDNDTNNCEINTHKSDNYTQSVMLTRMSVIMTLTKVITTLIRATLLCDVHTHTMINTRMNVISERKVWFQHARVWFIYVECDLYT
jgi:hypothetical protein